MEWNVVSDRSMSPTVSPLKIISLLKYMNILVKGLPYLSDPSVGAIAGLEMLLNPNDSWVTDALCIFIVKLA